MCVEWIESFQQKRIEEKEENGMKEICLKKPRFWFDAALRQMKLKLDFHQNFASNLVLLRNFFAPKPKKLSTSFVTSRYAMWPNLAKLCQSGTILSIWQFLEGYLGSICQILNLLWLLFAVVQIVIFGNGQILN